MGELASADSPALGNMTIRQRQVPMTNEDDSDHFNIQINKALLEKLG